MTSSHPFLAEQTATAVNRYYLGKLIDLGVVPWGTAANILWRKFEVEVRANVCCCRRKTSMSPWIIGNTFCCRCLRTDCKHLRLMVKETPLTLSHTHTYKTDTKSPSTCSYFSNKVMAVRVESTCVTIALCLYQVSSKPKVTLHKDAL